ncbi:nuclear transport factor 2 family protein [Streptomyces sp. CRN 30]|uniref:nuclear transport factor 2 family protein n=1 Tax=Streptomyces sp. CRN 30 TaxID=3075613 RepID=UPI002A81FDB3|nr:nuclear transport factor 2 family protein [Streptomyces sp. CRN 30]
MATQPASAAARVIDAQLAAYNHRDLEAFVACFAAGVELRNGGAPATEGLDGLRDLYAPQFATQRVEAEVRARLVLGEWVVDDERLTGPAPVALRALIAYRVRDGLIDRIEMLAAEPEQQPSAGKDGR